MTRESKEEFANSVTHAIGLALSVVGFPVLVVLAALRGSVWHVLSCGVYGGTLVCLYLVSTLYHSPHLARRKHLLQVLDHSSIYLFIAGTYTPFVLVNLHGRWGWTLFGLVWGLSLLGILLKVWFVEHFQMLSTTVYLMMGWLVVVAVKPLLLLVPEGGILWLLAGGMLYTAGVGFYAWRKLPYHHAIWHVFVLAGSVCHYFAVLYYVLPSKIQAS